MAKQNAINNSSDPISIGGSDNNIIFSAGQGRISRQASFGGIIWNSDNSINIGTAGFKISGGTVLLSAASGTPTTQTISGQNGTGSNIAGADTVIVAGISTGNATPGRVKIQAATVGSTGSTLNTANLVDVLIVASTGLAVTGNLTVSAPGTSTGNVATVDGTQTFTNKRNTPRVQTAADATSITPNCDSYDIVKQANTQGVGTLTINAPTGTPVDGQLLLIRISSTSVQTFSWNGAYQGSTDLTLPAVTSSSGKYDYALFIWNGASSKWDILDKNFGH